MRRVFLPMPALALAALVSAPALAAPPEFDDERLFTTAEQRAYLDELRAGTSVGERGGERRSQPDVPELEPEREPEPPPSVRLQGYVRRSGGPPAVWLNDDSTLAGDGVGGELRVHSGRIEGGRVIVDLPDGRSVRLRPGQTWDPESGRVVDSYRR